MLSDLRFAVGAVLAVVLLGATALGMFASVQVAHRDRQGPLEASRGGPAIAEHQDWNQFPRPEDLRRYNEMARQMIGPGDVAVEAPPTTNGRDAVMSIVPVAALDQPDQSDATGSIAKPDAQPAVKAPEAAPVAPAPASDVAPRTAARSSAADTTSAVASAVDEAPETVAVPLATTREATALPNIRAEKSPQPATTPAATRASAAETAKPNQTKPSKAVTAKRPVKVGKPATARKRVKVRRPVRQTRRTVRPRRARPIRRAARRLPFPAGAIGGILPRLPTTNPITELLGR